MNRHGDGGPAGRGPFGPAAAAAVRAEVAGIARPLDTLVSGVPDVVDPRADDPEGALRPYYEDIARFAAAGARRLAAAEVPGMPRVLVDELYEAGAVLTAIAALAALVAHRPDGIPVDQVVAEDHEGALMVLASRLRERWTDPEACARWERTAAAEASAAAAPAG